ncbi:enoyl-CoA hydratase/isomerase family protein [Luteimonas sp. BDR2-5]|uniref:enoyl-CoA hydratase/isomerase family protein n=1 Tax=Proluteimonas luteida TaxID=2878685 RepID=UPI001E579AA6|nr:enoyl-CoA hydratase-related protein [Luteimonas sp. BDR2-5]MCD9029740.1 enoyl-CoA hydratase/isomerase family protein [Luteimonas sp. BDR2-5]
MSNREPALLYRRDGHVARITFNRPAVLNAIDVDVARLFLEVCTDISRDPQVRAVVMQGAGRSFVAGGDLKVFQRDPADVPATLIDPMHEGLLLLAHSPAPVLASLHGVVAGAGLSLALACDLAIAAAGTRFNMAYLNVGASCDVGASWTLPRIVGLRRAMEIALLNPMLDAAEAQRIGMVNWVVPVEELAAKTDEIVARLVSGPPLATGWMKRLLRDSHARDLPAQLAAERHAFDACVATADFGEALVAFAEKRLPRYEGR